MKTSKSMGHAMSQKEIAYKDLRQRIITLELKPGSIISENSLSKEYSLSRTPIREIMKRLQDEYLIEIVPQTCTRVSKINLTFINETLFMRYALEKEVICSIRKEISPEDLSRLKDNIALQEFYFQRERVTEFHSADNEFHHLLFLAANKPRVYEILDGFSAHYDRLRLLRILVEPTANIQKYISDHKKIVEAIEGKVTEEIITEILTDHILRAKDELMKQGEKLGLSEYFE